MYYFVTRAALAWKQSRLDIAEHMFAKATPSMDYIDSIAAEDLAEVLFNIGNELMPQADPETALVWLRRSYDMISRHDLLRAGPEAAELKRHILQRNSEFHHFTSFLSQNRWDFAETNFSFSGTIKFERIFSLAPGS